MSWGFWAPFLLYFPWFLWTVGGLSVNRMLASSSAQDNSTSDALCSTGNTMARSHWARSPPRMLKSANTPLSCKESKLQRSGKAASYLVCLWKPFREQTWPSWSRELSSTPRTLITAGVWTSGPHHSHALNLWGGIPPQQPRGFALCLHTRAGSFSEIFVCSKNHFRSLVSP